MLSPFLKPNLPYQQSFTLTESQLPTLATALVKVAKPNAIISIEGGLGAGKTTLIRLLGQAIGVQTRMTSPTYVYFNQYTVPINPANSTQVLQVLHVDFYRLSENEAPIDANNWLVEELLELQAQAPTVIFAEWASVVGQAFQPLITHHLQITEAEAEENRRYEWYSHQRLAL